MTPSSRPIGPAKLQHATTDRPNHTAENIISDSPLHESHRAIANARPTTRSSRSRSSHTRPRAFLTLAVSPRSSSARLYRTPSTAGWAPIRRTRRRLKDRIKLSAAKLGRQALNRFLHYYTLVVVRTGYFVDRGRLVCPREPPAARSLPADCADQLRGGVRFASARPPPSAVRPGQRTDHPRLMSATRRQEPPRKRFANRCGRATAAVLRCRPSGFGADAPGIAAPQCSAAQDAVGRRRHLPLAEVRLHCDGRCCLEVRPVVG